MLRIFIFLFQISHGHIKKYPRKVTEIPIDTLVTVDYCPVKISIFINNIKNIAVVSFSIFLNRHKACCELTQAEHLNDNRYNG